MSKKLLRSIFALFLSVFMFVPIGKFCVIAESGAISDGAVFKPGETMTVTNATLWLNATDTLQFGGTATVTLGTMRGSNNRYSIPVTYSETPVVPAPAEPMIIVKGDGTENMPDGIKAVKDNTQSGDTVYRFEAYYAPTSVSITNKPEQGSTLEKGDTLQLTASATPSGASQAVAWESSDPNIATVEQDGTVTGVGAGTATITVKSAEDDKITDSCTVTVVQKYDVTVNKTGDGEVSVSPQSAHEGETVTVTVAPGYYQKLNSLTYTDAAGVAQTISKNDEGAYTFVMPKANTIVNAQFGLAPRSLSPKWIISENRNKYYLSWINEPDVENVNIYIGQTSDASLVTTVSGGQNYVDLTEYVRTYLNNKTGSSGNHVLITAAVEAVGDDWTALRHQTQKDLSFYKITLDNKTGSDTGTIELKNGDEDTWFLVGDSITVSVTPERGYHLSEVTADFYDGAVFTPDAYKITDEFLEDNEYTFELTEIRDDAQQPDKVTEIKYLFINASFELDPPLVTLELGEGHTGAVTKLYNLLKEEEAPFIHNVIEPEPDATALKVRVKSDANQNQSGYLQREFTNGLIDVLTNTKRIDNNQQFLAFGRNEKQSYSSRDAVEKEFQKTEPLGPDGITFYALWEDPISSLSLKVNDNPVCGVIPNKFDEETYEYEIQHPDAEILSDNASIIVRGNVEQSVWSASNDAWAQPLEDAFVGGETYYALLGVEPKFGYYFTDNMTIDAGEDTATRVQQGLSWLDEVLIAVEKTAVHDWDYENPEYKLSDDKKTATATVKCKNEDCDETQVFTDSNVDKTVQDPTIAADGVTTYTASFDHPEIADKVWTETIPMIKYQLTSGDGQTWTKGSGKTADFVFKRTYSDTSYDHFTGIKVDGKDVTKENYTAIKGSTIVKLNAAYLETLSVGNHKLTGIFTEEVPDAGKKSANVDATFIVKEAKKSSGGSSKKPTTPVDNVVTCQMAGYPANYSWNEAAKACQPGYIDAGGNFHPYGATVRRVPNTSDRDIMIHAWIAMLSVTIGLFCAIKLLHEDWEV